MPSRGEGSLYHFMVAFGMRQPGREPAWKADIDATDKAILMPSSNDNTKTWILNINITDMTGL